jgi:hypothetical protein
LMNCYFHCNLFMETSSTSGKANLPLAHSNLLHYFCIGLNLLSFRREPQGGKNLIPAKKKDFFPSAFYSH